MHFPFIKILGVGGFHVAVVRFLSACLTREGERIFGNENQNTMTGNYYQLSNLINYELRDQ